MRKHTPDEIKAWQQRLENNFKGPNGLVGERVKAVSDQEKSNAARTLRSSSGYVTIMDCFLDFCFQTFEEATKHEPAPHFFDIGLYLSSFWRLKASYNLFWDGYIDDGHGLLRGVYENVIYRAAVQHGFVDKQELYAVEHKPGTDPVEHLKKLNAHKSNVEREVRKKMVGAESGLSEENQKSLETMWQSMHLCVHRCEATVFSIIYKHAKGDGISILPQSDKETVNQYCNLSCFVAWCFLRLLPFLSSQKFSDDWIKHFQILDQSFNFMFEAHEQQWGRAVEELLAKRFIFKW